MCSYGENFEDHYYCYYYCYCYYFCYHLDSVFYNNNVNKVLGDDELYLMDSTTSNIERDHREEMNAHLRLKRHLK